MSRGFYVGVAILVFAGIIVISFPGRVPCCAIPPEPLRHYNAIKSDLRALAALQERRFREEGSYADGVAALSLQLSHGVQLRLAGTDDGWAAWASHDALSEDEGCGVFVGEAWPLDGVPVAPDSAGLMACTGGW